MLGRLGVELVWGEGKKSLRSWGQPWNKAAAARGCWSAFLSALQLPGPHRLFQSCCLLLSRASRGRKRNDKITALSPRSPRVKNLESTFWSRFQHCALLHSII